MVGYDGDLVMPFYLVCDVSYSMRDEMKTLHDEVTRLWQAIRRQGVLDDVILVCVMTFSDHVDIPVELVRMSDCPGIPEFVYGNEAHYGMAFRRLAEEIPRDYAALRREGWRVHQPCVYFLTGGEPYDGDWHRTFTQTVARDLLANMGEPDPPIFVPFGFRDARVETLRRLAYPPEVSKWYQASYARIEDALEDLLSIIRQSLEQSSTTSLMGGGPRHILPDPWPGSGIRYGSS